MAIDLPSWRSLLFIPANNQAFVRKAHSRGADAIILDLEDSVPPEQKVSAREQVPTAAEYIDSNGTDVVVRINCETAREDIAAATTCHVKALVVPKVVNAKQLQDISLILSGCEQAAGLPNNSVRLIAQIEDVAALNRLDDIACSTDRLVAMSLGSEDFSASASMNPTRETLYWPNLQVVFACRRAGILPLGFPDSITLISDQSSLREAALLAADMGMEGAFCIHPTQVDVLNKALSPTVEQLQDARLLIHEYDQSQTNGAAVFVYKGKMVDLPVVVRAKAMLAKAERIAKK